MDISALLLYYEEVFQQTLQAGLLTSGSSYWLHLPLDKRLRVASATFVTEYSGGTVPFAPINEFLPQRHKGTKNLFICVSRLVARIIPRNRRRDSLLVPIVWDTYYVYFVVRFKTT